jgi:hypothetical protein
VTPKSANTDSFSTTLSVDQNTEEVFAAVTNARSWRLQNIEGSANGVGDDFSYRHADVLYSKQ